MKHILLSKLFFGALIFILAPLSLLSAHAAQAHPATLVVLGDSLSAGHGIDVRRGWVRQLQIRLTQRGYRYHVVNASISGDTTAGGLARLPQTLALNHPAVVIVELGGNDGLRGLAIAEIRHNLSAIIRLAQARGSKVMLITMRLPPNYGPVYTQQFQDLFTQLARQYRAAVAPFILDRIAGHDDLMQADGIHPVAEAQPQMLANIWPTLEPLLHKP